MARFERRPALVFVTADEEGALEAFDLAAVDYLLKPVRTERLHRSVSRIVEALKAGAAAQAGAAASEPQPEMIAVTLGGTTRMIRRDEVRYVQAQGDYARLHTEEASYLVRVPMSDLERQWADAFVRIHRSYLVAIGHLTPHPARRRPPERRGRRGRAAGQPAAAARPARAARGGDDPAAAMSDERADAAGRRRADRSRRRARAVETAQAATPHRRRRRRRRACG